MEYAITADPVHQVEMKTLTIKWIRKYDDF